MDNALQSTLAKVGQVVEASVDAEIQRLDNLLQDDDELERIRERRVAALKKHSEQKQIWLNNQHGVFTEVAGEPEFFDACKRSDRIVCHFYRNTTMRCKIVDAHLEKLAAQHLETRFIKINVEKAHFLVDRLKIRIIPTIAMLKDNKTLGYIRGFDEMGGVDDFSTPMLEWVLAKYGVISYAGDLSQPPTGADGKTTSMTFVGKGAKQANIRDDGDRDSD